MNEFILQPGIYSTSETKTLFEVLDTVWRPIPDPTQDSTTYFVVTAFGTNNGGLRFFERFRHHVDAGGSVKAILGGSKSMRMCSRQLAQGLLSTGADVRVVNRNKIMHSKLYGSANVSGSQHLITSSGNFTPQGLALNIESTLSLGPDMTSMLGFSWDTLWDTFTTSDINIYKLNPNDTDDPAWDLLYDEMAATPTTTGPDAETLQLESLIISPLGHADTVRLHAEPGSSASLGSQYFWLSKDAYDFFPPLTIRNTRGVKATYSALINVNFVDLDLASEVRVTFEAENNLDFRLGTGPLRGAGIAHEGDMMVLTRRDTDSYEMAIVPHGTDENIALSRYALDYIGNQGKRYGYAPNTDVDRLLYSR